MTKDLIRVVIFAPVFGEYSVRLARSIGKQARVLLIADLKSATDGCFPGMLEPNAGFEARLYRLSLTKYHPLALFIDALPMIKQIMSFHPDVVHFQEYPHPLLPAVAALVKRRAKTVVTVHDPVAHSGRDSSVDRPSTRRWIRGNADLLLAHGPFCCDFLRSVAPCPDVPIRETRHGVLLVPPPDLIRDPVPGRILFFGRMEAYKGLEILLHAAEILCVRRVDFSLHLAGEGSELERLRDRFEGLPDVVIRDEFLQPTEATIEFQEASIVVLPYLDSTQSGVAAAAFGNGRPVIASRIGGLTDVVKDRVNGLLVEANNAEALADAIQIALESQSLLASLRCGAEETAKLLLDWDDIAAETISYYHELLNNKGVQP